MEKYLKGQYDKHRGDFKILVTGSARLDVYRRGGDSLMGRYFYYRLHPFSLAECFEKQNLIKPLDEISIVNAPPEASKALASLIKFGGFPEPFLKQSERGLRRWHSQRLERLVKEDIRDLENIRDLSSLQILVDLIPTKVGSLLSLNALREDLSVAHKTVANWMDILERFYYHFRIYPFTNKKIKSLKKEPKLYLWDWSEITDNRGAKLENYETIFENDKINRPDPDKLDEFWIDARFLSDMIQENKLACQVQLIPDAIHLHNNKIRAIRFHSGLVLSPNEAGTLQYTTLSLIVMGYKLIRKKHKLEFYYRSKRDLSERNNLMSLPNIRLDL